MGKANKSGKTSRDFGQQFSSHKKQYKLAAKSIPANPVTYFVTVK
jgi:hypothetical protein